MKSLIALVAVLCTSGVITSGAQVRVVRYGDDRLAGIHAVDLVVQIVSQDGASCGPARDTLQSAARVTLRGAGLDATVSEKAPSWFYSVVLHLISAPVENGCATAITTELVAEIQGIPEADRSAPSGAWGALLVGRMPLVTTRQLVTTTVREHDSAVREVVRDHLMQIAARLRAANPRP